LRCSYNKKLGAAIDLHVTNIVRYKHRSFWEKKKLKYHGCTQ
jgi:hypothetical protein